MSILNKIKNKVSYFIYKNQYDIFYNIIWCFDKPYSKDAIVRAAVTTSHFIIPNRRGNKNHNRRQYIRKRLLNSRGIYYKLDLK